MFAQQGLQQELETKSGNQIPLTQLPELQLLQVLQQLQAINSPPDKNIAEAFASTTFYATWKNRLHPTQRVKKAFFPAACGFSNF